jgi:hypothetical protein
VTKTEICNRALAALGHDRTITDFDADTSTEAVRCREFFASALGDCLCEHDWDFAAVETHFAAVPPGSDGYARLPHPEDSIRISAVVNSEGKPLKIRRTRDALFVENFGEAARIRYVSKDVEAESLPHKFAEALVYRLASLLAGPMYGSDSKTQGFAQIAAQKLAEAVTRETDETADRGEWQNPFITARR